MTSSRNIDVASAERPSGPVVSLVIPAYNEEATLEEVVNEAINAASLVTANYEVVIVNDGSADRTGKIADRLASHHEAVRAVHHTSNRGFSGAMQSCIENAIGDYVFLGPADGQARYEDLVCFWELIDRYELIFSEQMERKDGLHRKLASAVFYTFFRVLFGERLPQFSATFLFRRDAIPQFPVAVRPDASNFLPVLYLTAISQGHRICVIATPSGPRRGGVAKGSSVSNAVRTMTEDVTLWWRLRIRHGRRWSTVTAPSQSPPGPSAPTDAQHAPSPVESVASR
ncbi:MAG TPA: glycosyltransferase family 2 protein [Solirubrobacteraceae bacterium]|jgi:glycosyltransferase involved in cell wall biosynthesis|nr:glycosyltransferase family 2 protein [Solirubrobacteraceae bacterium]